jgi:hypothetical protein
MPAITQSHYYVSQEIERLKEKKKSFVPFCIPTVRGMFEKLFDNNSSLFDTHPLSSGQAGPKTLLIFLDITLCLAPHP